MNRKAQTTVAGLFALGAMFLAISFVVFLDAFKNDYLGLGDLVLVEFLVGGVFLIAGLSGIYLSRK